MYNFMLSFHGNLSQGRLCPLKSKIEEKINSIFRGKTTNQLEQLKKNIDEKLRKNNVVDVSYWERLLQHIQVSIDCHNMF